MSSQPNRCAFHADRPSAFRCRSCRRGYCEECRAPEQRENCVRCDMAIGAREAADLESDVMGVHIARKRSAVPLVIGALLVVNLGLGIWWVVGRDRLPSQVEEAFDAIHEIAAAVEQGRDTSGRVPPTLDGIAARLPPAAAILARSGDVRYRPSADRRTFALERVFDRHVPPGTAEEDQR